MSDRADLTKLLTDETRLPVAPEVLALSAAIQARGQVAAILYYGSGLWKASTADTIHDFYAIVDRYRDFDSHRLSAILGQILPPNVYFIETTEDGIALRAKVAVITRGQFARMTRGRTPTPQIWARFAQPCRIVYMRTGAVQAAIIDDLSEAVLSFHRHALSLLPSDADAETVWRRGLADTYAAELRPEQPGRAVALFAASQASLTARTQLARAILRQENGRAPLWLPIPILKLLAFLRLLKGTLTFSGSVDYILWKVARQSGVHLTATPRQRRYPLLFAWPLVWTLYRRGGFR